MATKAQINANRVNSQKSTGPRTDEGKRSVSQNAVKHGLFAYESVIKCEDPADFELHRAAILSELWPVGVMESMMAERIVSLSWRMLRAERMQNQATDCLIEEDYLPLGRMATKNQSDNLRMIERLFMHERRIESSMHKTINKFKKLQIMRRIEREDAEERLLARATAAEGHNSNLAKQSQSPAAGRRREARNPKDAMSGAEGSETSGAGEGTFVKRSHFEPDLMGTTPFVETCYNGTSPAGVRQDEANQSQFHRPISARAVEESAR